MCDADGMRARSPWVTGLVVGLTAVAMCLVLGVTGAHSEPRLTIAPKSAPVGRPVTVRGYGFRPRLEGVVVFGSRRVASFRAGAKGNFLIRFVVPAGRHRRLRVIGKQIARGWHGSVHLLSQAAAGFRVLRSGAPATQLAVVPGNSVGGGAGSTGTTGDLTGNDGSTGGSASSGEGVPDISSTHGPGVSNGGPEGSGGSTGGSRWAPPRSLTWYLQLQGAINDNESVAAYDIDGFENTAAEVSTLHAQGKHAVCYIDVGTAENFRPDYSSFPASVLGNSDGWAGEQWLDVRQLSTLEPIMSARFEMCREKGFDAVDPDNMDGYENDTGFPITAQEQLTYDEWVATEVHSLGMAVFQKNDSAQVKELEPYFDGEIAEQCNEYHECADFQPYLTAGKPVIDIEYSLPTSSFCAADNAAGIMGARYSLELNGTTFEPCW